MSPSSSSASCATQLALAPSVVSLLLSRETTTTTQRRRRRREGEGQKQRVASSPATTSTEGGGGNEGGSSSSVAARSSPRTDVERSEEGESPLESRCSRPSCDCPGSFPSQAHCESGGEECPMVTMAAMLAFERGGGGGDSQYATVRRGKRDSPCKTMSRREELERRYGGREVANAAAAAVQRWYRAARLQKSFSKLMELAMSSERLDRRLSLLGPDLGDRFAIPQQQQQQQQQHHRHRASRQLRHVEDNIDRIILEAAGLMRSCNNNNSNVNGNHGPSARHIKNRRTGAQQLRRSVSLRADRVMQQQQRCDTLPRTHRVAHQQQQQIDPRSRDDLDLPPSPVPPCPPLRGEVIYAARQQQQQQQQHQMGEDPIYVTRDDLYHQQELQRLRYSRENLDDAVYGYASNTAISHNCAAPRPPQRTVSFLNAGTLPRKVSQVRVQQQQQQQQQQQHHRIYSDGDLRSRLGLDVIHNRCHSSPVSAAAKDQSRSQPQLSVDVADTSGDSDKCPLPPPPYISPPEHRRKMDEDKARLERVVNLPPPPSDDLPSPPLPPPPPMQQQQQQQPRPPCDSASSSSSIDSGYGRSSVSDGSNANHFNNNGGGVFEPRPNFGHIMQIHHLRQHSQLSHTSSFSQNRPAANGGLLVAEATHAFAKPTSVVGAPANYAVVPPFSNNNPADSPKLKKTVRIRTPEKEEDLQNAENQQQQQLLLLQQQQQIQQQLQQQKRQLSVQRSQTVSNLVEADVFRRRQYRVGLNLFNQTPDIGMEYLLKKGFLDYSPAAAARFLRGRKGLSKRAVGDYLTDLRRPFNLAALHCFVHELDFAGLHLDIALRQLQEEVTFPGEAQKIEKMVEVFSKRYIQCNQMFVSGFRSPDTLFVLSYAVVLLNTDLHTRAVRRDARRMRRDDFVRNLRGVDAGADPDREMLEGIYDRIKRAEFRPGSDHVSQVSKVEESLTGKGRGWQSLSEPHRRLVCFCRLTEVPEKKERPRPGAHQRGVFLFNDLLLVTKTASAKKGRTQHQFRFKIPLRDVAVRVFSTPDRPFGVQLLNRSDEDKVLATFDARGAGDRDKFVADLRESVAETLEMDKARMFLNSSQTSSLIGKTFSHPALPVNEESLMLAPESFC